MALDPKFAEEAAKAAATVEGEAAAALRARRAAEAAGQPGQKR